MEHVVFFPAPDGTPAFRRVASLEDAVRLVEHLRNVEGVNEVSVHALSEVPLAFKAWYRVEVPAAEPAPAEPAAAPADLAAPLDLGVPGVVPDLVPDAAPAPVAPEPVAEVPAELVVPEQGEHQQDQQEPVAVLAASHGEQVQRSSSLGFFAS